MAKDFGIAGLPAGEGGAPRGCCAGELEGGAKEEDCGEAHGPCGSPAGGGAAGAHGGHDPGGEGSRNRWRPGLAEQGPEGVCLKGF